MFFLLEKLCGEIGDKKEIIIYGAGYFASEIYGRLCAVGWKDKIKCFAVTAIGTQSEYIESIPVVKYEELLLEEEVCLLVAVGDAYLKEIKNILGDVDSKQVFYLWDYMVSESERNKMLLNDSFDMLCQHALDEYIWKDAQRLNSKEKLLKDLKLTIHKNREQQRLDKSIVYVLEEETARDIKIIKALLENEYKITVLQRRCSSQYVAEKELLNLDVVLEQFDCIWDFIVKSLKCKPMLYFVDAEMFFEYALVLIRHRDIWGRTVIAPYETFIGSFVGIDKQIFEFEKYCLENADAIVWRYFSKDYLQKKMGYRFKGDSIQLLDYCGGYEITEQSMEISGDRLKLCYVVSQIDSFLRWDTTEFTQPARFVDLLDRLDASCELHVFAWSASVDAERQLRALEQEYTNFKYFIRVEHNDLIRRISTYDYGLCVYTNERIPEYPMGAETICGGLVCTEGTYRYSVANRYFDYIDAELAVITTLPEKLCEYLQKFDVIIRMNSSNLDPDYLKANKAYYKERAKAAKKELLMSKHISKLTDMFERICSDGNC